MSIMDSLLQQKEIVVKGWLTYYISVDDPYVLTLKDDHRLMDETGLILENLFIGMTEDLTKMNTFARDLGKAQFITSLGISRILFHIRLLEEFLLDYASEIHADYSNYRDLYLFSIKLHQVFSSFTQNLIEGYTLATELLVQQKENQIIKNSTKLIWLAEKVFLLPLIGKITDDRAKQITETALFEACEQPVNYLIIDLSGAQFDSANIGEYIEHFFSSLKLVGVTPIITGMQPQTAKVMIQVNLTEQKGIKTFATLRQATKSLMKEKEARNAPK
ncbi:STAS domain-containing protein [Listeria sp. FSL L7-0091]|uniref:STAS domain-containing protein n=1 Tax=Listeria farberi TaxID=2713500 RepID=A0A7X1DEC6_9LIST|nr:STAS domain-containing protein [Listeria farberi]MBC1375539.1 STAS domain-containing protein [Listeria farberi]MBC1381472.1 STAS domain-containing protein [Listeria farberi]MBC2260246.1 STAS domain-containing protein [Listeria farberi]MBC2267964.1 STAS domain-containing protein [Listeria farberi]MBC2287555.1 STAS domain-containing protein [Listeria farberi]